MPGISNSVDRFNGVVADRAIKVPCVVATSVDITLEAIQTIDSVLVASGDRVLVRSQTNAVENGIYDVKDAAWQRAADWDGSRDIGQGTLVGAYDSVGNLSLYEVTTVDPIVVGSTAVAIAFYIAGAGAALEAGTITNAMLRWDGVDTYRETDRIRATADGANFQVYEVTETDFLDVSYVGTSAILVLSNAAHNFDFQNDVNVSAGDLYLGQVMYIDEQNVASGSTGGQGQLWVKDDAPNVLVYTDDTGVDTVLGSGVDGTVIDSTVRYDGSVEFVENVNFLVEAAGRVTLKNTQPIRWEDGAASPLELLVLENFPAYTAGVGSVTLNFNGTDGDRTYTGDDGRVWTFVGTTGTNQIDKARSKWHSTAYLFGTDGAPDADGMVLNVQAENADFHPGTRDWYVRMWVNQNDVSFTGANALCSISPLTGNNRVIRWHIQNNGYDIAYAEGGTSENTFPGFGASAQDDQFHEVVFERVGNGIYCYEDGVQNGATFNCTGHDIGVLTLGGDRMLTIGNDRTSGAYNTTPDGGSLDGFEMKIGENIYGGVAPGSPQTLPPVAPSDVFYAGEPTVSARIFGLYPIVDGSLDVTGDLHIGGNLTGVPPELPVLSPAGTGSINLEWRTEFNPQLVFFKGGGAAEIVATGQMHFFNAPLFQIHSAGAGTSSMQISHNGTKGEIKTNSTGGFVECTADNGGEDFRFMFGTAISIDEKAAARAPVADLGQIWVRNDVPNVLMFTDDAGTDFLLNGAGGTLPAGTADFSSLFWDAGAGVWAEITKVRWDDVAEEFEVEHPSDSLAVMGLSWNGASAAGNATLELGSNKAGSQGEIHCPTGGLQILNASTLEIHSGATLASSGLRVEHSGTLGRIYTGTGDGVIEMFANNGSGDVEFNFGSGIKINEKAAANADIANKGQIWVRSDVPNVLMYTDDAGTDFEIGGAGVGGGNAVGSITWIYDDSINVNADPGAGQIVTGSALLNVDGAFALSDTDKDGTDIQHILSTIPKGGYCVVTKADDKSQFRVYGIESVADNTGWYRFGRDYQFGSGASTSFTDGDEVTVEFFATSYVHGGTAASNSVWKEIPYWDVNDSAWKPSGANLLINPSTPPNGGRLRFGGTSGGNVTNPNIMQIDPTSDIAMDFVYSTSNTAGFYTVFDNGTPEFKTFGARVASVNTHMLSFDASLNLRVEAGATFLIGEKGAAGTDVAGFGQIWVDNAVAPAQQLWFTDDVGGDYPVSQPTVLWNAGNQIVQALVDGVSIESANSNDPTAGAAQDGRVLWQNDLAAPIAEFGFASVALLAIESYVHGGGIEIRAEDSSGVVQEAMVFDPDAVLSLRGVTNVEILSNETQSAILCVDSAEVALYYNSALSFQTALYSATDMISGAQVDDAEGNLQPVGVGVVIDDATNWGNGTITPFQQGNATQGIIHDDATATLMNTYASTGFWYDGGGSTPSTGTRTIARGSVVAVRKISDTVYRIWGNGIT